MSRLPAWAVVPFDLSGVPRHERAGRLAEPLLFISACQALLLAWLLAATLPIIN